MSANYFNERAPGYVGFDGWMAAVNAALEDRVGLTSHDLPDWSYADAWDSGQEPEEAASDCLMEVGYDDFA